MRLGLKPVVYEQGRLGGRLRSQVFQGADGIIAELGGMRFPISSTSFYHYADFTGLQRKPFPNPLDAASPSTIIDLEGEISYIEGPEDLPPLLREVQHAWAAALEAGADFGALQQAIRSRDVTTLKQIWNRLVPLWDERTFYDFVASAKAFQDLSFRHREVFGQVGFGTGGWDSDFPNSMLEILRVVATGLDDDQQLIVGGVEQLPRRLWNAHRRKQIAHWPAGTSLNSLAWRRAAAQVSSGSRAPLRIRIAVTDRWGGARGYTPRCSPPASPGCSPPPSPPARICFRKNCGWRWTAPATCNPPKLSSWWTAPSGATATPSPTATA